MLTEGSCNTAKCEDDTSNPSPPPIMNRLAALRASKSSSSQARPVNQAPPPPLRELENPGILLPAPSQAARRFSERQKRKREEHGGKSIKEALEIQRSKAKVIDLSNPFTGPALRKLGLPEHARTASLAQEGHEKEMAAILRPDDECALPQQHNDLTGKQVLKKNYDAARYGGPRAGEFSGFTYGELGTIKNGKGKTVDAARSQASKAMKPFEGHLAKVSFNQPQEIPKLVRNQGKKGSIPADSIQLIDIDDQPIDHRNTTEEEFQQLVRGAHGYEMKDTTSFDAVIAHFRPKEAKRARRDKAKWRDLRSGFISTCKSDFEFERFDDDGVLSLSNDGPKSLRRANAKYRLRFIENDKRFEYLLNN